jgi:hypothetical protein
MLARAAARQPLVVVLDDLHWGDADSLRLFDFLTQARTAAPILLIGSYRDVEVRRDRPLALLLGGLAGRPRLDRFELRGLEPSAVAEIVAAVAGGPRPELGAALAERTGGNPFFVHELVRLMDDEGHLAAGAGPPAALGLPQGIRDAIGRRLDRLSPACNEGPPGRGRRRRSRPTRVLEAPLTVPRAALLERLAEAETAGIVVADPDVSGRRALPRARA